MLALEPRRTCKTKLRLRLLSTCAEDEQAVFVRVSASVYVKYVCIIYNIYIIYIHAYAMYVYADADVNKELDYICILIIYIYKYMRAYDA